MRRKAHKICILLCLILLPRATRLNLWRDQETMGSGNEDGYAFHGQEMGSISIRILTSTRFRIHNVFKNLHSGDMI